MKVHDVKRWFAVNEAVVLTGFSKPMLDYLARDKIFELSLPVEPGRGVRRRYAYSDIVVLRALHEICAGKGRIRQLKGALARLKQELGPLRPGQRLDKLLFVQGNELCLRTHSEAGRELRTGQMTLGFMVDLGAVTGFVAETIEVGRHGVFSLKPTLAEMAEVERQRNWNVIRERRLEATAGAGAKSGIVAAKGRVR